jgi:hypothetical protein
MRLIRLTTEENDGRFDCDFNEDLVIPPNSQIALHSFTTQFPSTNIVINSLNNELLYTVNGTTNTKIILPEGTYTNANVQEFFSQTQQKLNESLAYAELQVGKQWRAGIFGGKTQFTVAQGRWTNSGEAILKNVDVIMTPGTFGQYQRSGGTIATNDAFIYFNRPIVKGSGFFNTKLLVDSTVQTNGGFILTLTSNCPNASTTTIRPDTIEYGIRFNGVGIPYSDITNGVTTESATLGQLGDTVQFTYALGTMTYNIVRADNTNIVLKTSPFNHMSNYFPVVVYNGDCKTSTAWYVRDPFYTLSGTLDDNLDLDLTASGFPIAPQFAGTNNFFQFNSASLAKEFGYATSRIPENGFINTVHYAYTATTPFQLRDYSDTYIVELLNIQLNSMDAMTKQHKNYLAIVPHLQDLRELVVYVSPMLIFLDLNNKFPLSYRQIKARILRDDLTPVTTYGLTQMAILIKSYDE